MDRRARHERASAWLAAADDCALAELVTSGDTESVGVGGGSLVATVDGQPVFVKRIPLTDLELAHPHSTANLFGVPLSCQYGISSPGFTAWRELAANLTLTEAVLAGRTEAFPLLHHWRVLPGRSPVAEEYADLDAAVTTMGGDQGVRSRIEALAAASWSLVLFSEYLPEPLTDWLRADRAASLERQLSEIVTALRDHELLHMDGHFGNIRADGEQIFLTDFGLVTSPRFDLDSAEREFVQDHLDHDAAYASMRLVNWLVTAVCGVDGEPAVRNEYVRQLAAGRLPDDLPPHVVPILARHAAAAVRSNDLYWRLFSEHFERIAQLPEERSAETGSGSEGENR